jgi:UDPglucose 6-dehydrogenase
MPFLCASLAWGGSCFEKDILSLAYILESNGLIEAARYWESVLLINNAQKKRLCDKVQANLSGEGHVAILGFAFKNKTSDTRMTPVSFVANYFMEQNRLIKITDPQASEEGYRMEMEFMHYPIKEEFSKYVGSNLDEAVTGAQAIVVCTEWEEFQQLNLQDWKRLRALMTPNARIYDLRSYLDVEVLKEAGFENVYKLGNPFN